MFILKSTNKNFLYNIIYQVFIFIIPLITTPYVSRILGVNNVGIYSYTYSIVYYFMLASMLGINNYGAREIAKASNNKNKLSKTFFSIYFLQLICCGIMAILYIIVSSLYQYDHKEIMFIQFIYLISCIFDINWFFFGLEKFKITISRNVIIKMLSLILIFTLVNSRSELWLYTLIMSGSTLISQIYLWIYVKKEIHFYKPTFKEIFKHLPECLILFIPIISYSIYRVMDKTLIGAISNTVQLGNFESAEKIINIPISFITALGTVMMPHMSKTTNDEYTEKLNDTFKLCFFFIIPMIIGLFVISDDFSNVFFGDEFSLTGTIIKYLLPTILFSAITNVIRSNYLIPKGKNNIYVISTILGAVVNLILNLIFIKRYGALGACIGTLAAEFTVMFYQILATRKIINYIKVFKIGIPFLIESLLVGLLIYLIGIVINNIWTRLIVQIIIAVIIYITINWKYIIYDFFGKKTKKKIKTA